MHPTWIFVVITAKDFALEQVIYDRQVGQAGKNDDASISDNNVSNAFVSRKLNYRRLEEGRIFLILNKNFFFYFQPCYGLLLFLILKKK